MGLQTRLTNLVDYQIHCCVHNEFIVSLRVKWSWIN